jgi:NADP-dependent 3-hydroxy acid dehydrogenase YdfG
MLHESEALSDAGANVALCSRRLEQLEEARQEIEARGRRALAVRCHVTKQEDVEGVVSLAEETFGSVDILVNNSGATWGTPPAEMPPEKLTG